jgi:exo-beta-1,3-glucanase (GH17 family)
MRLWSRFCGPALALTSLLAFGGSASAWQNPPVKATDAVWIYRDSAPETGPDSRSASERLFAPFGFMPGERSDQISVNIAQPVAPGDPSKGTCIEYLFEFRAPDDWMGSYTLVDGNCWGTKPGIDVQLQLGIDRSEPVVLRFRARGGGTVTFKCGGVVDGEHPSSLRPAREPAGSPTRLTHAFRDYTIGPFPASQLKNIIDPFCVVATILDNRGRKTVRLEVDDIRFERLRPPKRGASLPAGWRDRLSGTLFVTYTPTGFNPTTQPVTSPTAKDIRDDLAAIQSLTAAAGVPAGRIGVITYGCRDGLEQIPPLACERGIAVLLGIFNPLDRVEVDNAARLLERAELEPTIVACCVGNEALTFRRARLDEIRKVCGQLRAVRPVPLTTTEIIQSYGNEALFEFDFTLVNAHALFASVYSTDKAGKWAVGRIEDLLAAAPQGHLVLVKEIGWRAAPPPFDRGQQRRYWETVLSSPVARRVNIAFFDGLSNLDTWKSERISLPGHDKPVDIGPHWPVLFDSGRKPKSYAIELLRLWKTSRAHPEAPR